MTSFPLSRVLLPAVVISTAVFSALTVPLALIREEPIVIELPPLFNVNDAIEPIEIQPIFNGEHKEDAIPYVGFAIVVSVGAGIGSVEIHRRWYAYRKAIAQDSSFSPPANSQAQETQKDPSLRPEFRPQASAIDLPNTNQFYVSQPLHTAEARPEESIIQQFEAAEQVADNTQSVDSPETEPEETTASAAVLVKPNLSQLKKEHNSENSVSSQVASESTVQEQSLDLSNIICSRQQYQTCRIKVPRLERSLFAIKFQGEYYSFSRAETTKEKLQDIMTKVEHKVNKTVITKTPKSYVIWLHEPEIYS